MLYGIIILLLTALLTEGLLPTLAGNGALRQRRTIRILYWWHILFVLIYYLFALGNASDSKSYYDSVFNSSLDWGEYYGISTTFIKWLNYPLVNYLGFTYEASMVFFGFLGFIGWVFVYRTFVERTQFNHNIKLGPVPVNFLILILFLPNNHFWSASLGKGSVIILGIGLFLYGLSKPQQRIWALVLGAVFAYHIRPHILYVMVMGSAVGLVFSQRGLPTFYRWSLGILALGALVFLLRDIQDMTQFEDFFSGDQEVLDNRAQELSKAGSGVDLTSMNPVEKLFAFTYRPLFFDAHNAFALYTSFENFLYLLLTLQFFRKDMVRFLFKGNHLVLTSLVTFFAVSFALAQISGNLGLAMRQKSQVFFLLLFVLLQYKDYKARQRFEWRMYRHQQSLAS